MSYRSKWTECSTIHTHPPEHRRGRVGAARGAGQSAAAGWVRGEDESLAAALRQHPLDRRPLQPGNPEQDRGAGSLSLRPMAEV